MAFTLSWDLSSSEAAQLEKLFNSSELTRRGISLIFAKSLRLLLKDIDPSKMIWEDVKCTNKLPDQKHGTSEHKIQKCMMVLAYEINRLLGIRNYKLQPYRGNGYQDCVFYDILSPSLLKISHFWMISRCYKISSKQKLGISLASEVQI